MRDEWVRLERSSSAKSHLGGSPNQKSVDEICSFRHVGFYGEEGWRRSRMVMWCIEIGGACAGSWLKIGRRVRLWVL